MTRIDYKTLTFICYALLFAYTSAASNPKPAPSSTLQAKSVAPTAAPLSLQSLTELRAVLDFYDPSKVLIQHQETLRKDQTGDSIKWSASPVQKRQQAYPTFPAQYPSWWVIASRCLDRIIQYFVFNKKLQLPAKVLVPKQLHGSEQCVWKCHQHL